MADETKAKPPLTGREIGLAAVMFCYFFLVIVTFWVLKPTKKTLFIGYYDEHGLDLFGSWHLEAGQAELIAKVLNMVVAFAAVVVFTALVRRLQREKLTYVFGAFFILTLGLYSLAIGWRTDWVVWSFYLYGDLYSTIMVATFFAFLNDSLSPASAKRLYGFIVLGGVLGGAGGSTVLRTWIEDISTPSWLWICAGLNIAVLILAAIAGRLVPHDAPNPTHHDPPPTAKQTNAAIEGASLVFRSPYLLSIVAIVGLYEIVSTVMDFQFSTTVSHYLSGDAIGEQFATVYMITNIASLVVQVLLTTAVMNLFPLRVALLITPLVILGASVGFLVVPVLWVGSMLNTADGAFSYSMNQSAREALYTPTTRDEKYKAKAFIDMFVQRVAKAVAVGVTLLITSIFTDFSSLRWLSLVTISVVAIWSVAAWYGGGKFRALTESKKSG